MCLNNNPNNVKKFLKKRRSFVWAYKMLILSDGKLFSPIYWGEWKEGFHNSNSEAKTLCMQEKQITRGIHVYLNRVPLNLPQKKDKDYVSVKVKCYIKDLIGVELGRVKHHGTVYADEAVFRRVYLPKTEFKRAIKKK